MIRVQVAVQQKLLRQIVSAFLRHQPDMELVERTGDGGVRPDAAVAVPPLIVVLSEPVKADPASWVADCRAATPGCRVVLLASRRAIDLGRGMDADAVVDAAEGLDALAAAIRKVDAA